MQNKKPFSIIELMTVILVILLLITLIIPAFEKIKMNARTALCKNNMRQIGVLLNSYQMDHVGYLPNDDWYSYTYRGTYYRGDIPNATIGNNQFYQNWNGHLLPYMEVNLPDKYTRYAMVTKVGCTRFDRYQLGGPPNAPPPNVLKNGWVVVDDAFRVGGYNDLKLFICPEIHQNTYDLGVSIIFNGIKIPKMSQLCIGGWAFRDVKDMDYGMGGGVPTTYLANDYFFGRGENINSKRIDEITEISQKAFLLEGGVADPFCKPNMNGDEGFVYYRITGTGPDGGDLSSSRSILNPILAPYQKLNYVHDNYDSFWIMEYYQPTQWISNLDQGKEIAHKFNIQFAGKASMVLGWDNLEGSNLSYAIVSNIYPDEGKVFKDFFMKYNPQAYPLSKFFAYVNEPNEFKYLTGDMNVLFGDGSVATKSQTWLCNNRQKIAAPTKE